MSTAIQNVEGDGKDDVVLTPENIQQVRPMDIHVEESAAENEVNWAQLVSVLRSWDVSAASWGEVFNACCIRDTTAWFWLFIGVFSGCFFLYFFLFGLNLLGSAANVLGGCSAGGLLGDDTNPVAAVVIGELATALVQSSSTTTSIIVTLVGAEAFGVRTGIYMIMGANIGTSVTNTIVSMGQMGDRDDLERAFSGATVQDLFNFLSVAVLFPLELISGYLYRFTKVILPLNVGDGVKWAGPVKKLVGPLSDLVIKANKSAIKDVATGKVESCDMHYPVICIDGIQSYKTCNAQCDEDAGDVLGVDCGRVGLITCDEVSGRCPAFFHDGAQRRDDTISGGVCLFLSLVLLIACLMGLVNVLQRGLLGMTTRVIHKATNVPGLLAIFIGAGVTVLVQSSSITTSVLTPFVGLGVIQLEQMLPLTLGANIGTTVTGLLASLVSENVDALQVALAHLFFNISGIIIWYPIPWMRSIPLRGARALGRGTRRTPLLPIMYIIVVFFVIPLGLLGLSSLFEQKTTGFTVLGSFLVITIAGAILRFLFWWKRQDGYSKCFKYLDGRQERRDALLALPEDMRILKANMQRLLNHTGVPVDEETATAEDELAVACIPEDEETVVASVETLGEEIVVEAQL